MSKEEKEMYDVELKRKWDKANILAYAKSQGRAEGLAEGEAKGEIKGKAEGLAEGEIKGKAEGHELAMETVIINGSKNGLTLEQIQAVTGWENDKISEVLKRNHLL